MKIEYWIYDREWKQVGCNEYFDFNGDKIIANGMGLSWALTMRFLRKYGCAV